MGKAGATASFFVSMRRTSVLALALIFSALVLMRVFMTNSNANEVRATISSGGVLAIQERKLSPTTIDVQALPAVFFTANQDTISIVAASDLPPAPINSNAMQPTHVTTYQQASTTVSAQGLAGQVKGPHRKLTRWMKKAMGDELQAAIDVVEREYKYIMDRHRYGNAYVSHEIYRLAAQGRQWHSAPCQAHEAGLVRVRGVPGRGYCFGAARLPGRRVCDSRMPNYKKMIGQKPYGIQMLYGRRFAIRPFFHKSKVTLANDEYTKTAVHIVSQGSLERLSHLQTLLTVWRGPVAFAVLLQSVADLKTLEAAVNQSELMQQYADIHAVWRLDEEDETTSFYPINMLRNIPLQLLPAHRTVFVLDIDVVPSAPMAVFQRETRSTVQKAAALANATGPCPGLVVLVPPAINMAGKALQSMTSQRDAGTGLAKESIVEQLYSGVATPMHLYFGPAYGPTGHYDWMTSDKVVEIPYLTRFEPYYIATTPLPLFNETFVNRGGNKAQQAMELAAGGYRFYRMPRVFVIDVPHAQKGQRPDKGKGGQQNNSTVTPQQFPTEGQTSNKNSSSEVIRFSNPTAQKKFDKTFISDQWRNFFDYLPHRYRINMPSPQSNDPAFRQYRRVYQQLMSLLWTTVGAKENALDLKTIKRNR